MSPGPIILGIALIGGLLAAAAPTSAQRLGVSPGDTVRITGPSLPSTHGVVVGIAKHAVHVSVDGRTDVVPIGSDTRIEVRRGKRPWGPVKGALLGTAVAIGLGLAWEASDSLERGGCVVVDSSSDGSPIYQCDKDSRNMDQAWLATGAVLGITTGFIIRVPRWLDASTAINVGVAPGRTMRVAVMLH